MNTMEQSSPGQSGRAPVVLLIDDDPMLREIGTLMLVDLGFSVLTAENGKEAMDILKEHREEIAVVLCDLMMPHMDGWQTLAALRRINPAVSWIMASGYGHIQETNPDKTDSVQVFLCKPYTMDNLEQAIARALSQKPSGA